MAIFDVIKFDGLKNRNWIVYKYPTENIIFGSQLIVQEGQMVIFVRGGRVCDIFEPGAYTLNTNNLPLIASIINMPFGGKTPFTAEVYFINAATKLDIFWGTTDPIQLVDPKYFVKLRIRAYGQMGLKLKEYRNFFVELIGGMNKADFVRYDKIKDFYKGLVVLKVKAEISEIIINQKISALEISTKLEEISEKVMSNLREQFEKYGFSVTNFYINSINFPDEDFEKINKILVDKAQFEIMGDARYNTKRSFDVYEGAATNSNGVAGAFAAGGIGMGAGLNIASNINNPNLDVSNNTSKICPKCGATNNCNSNYCNKCGSSLIPPKIKCPKCGCEVNEDCNFCNECGYNLQETICECGAKLKPGINFCHSCGKKVN